MERDFTERIGIEQKTEDGPRRVSERLNQLLKTISAEGGSPG